MYGAHIASGAFIMVRHLSITFFFFSTCVCFSATSADAIFIVYVQRDLYVINVLFIFVFFTGGVTQRHRRTAAPAVLE